MPFAETDLENIQTALIELATGSRIVKVTIGGKTIEYGQADIRTLKALRADIQMEINTIETTTSYFLTSTSKGL